jgi:hypothetical protein
MGIQWFECFVLDMFYMDSSQLTMADSGSPWPLVGTSQQANAVGGAVGAGRAPLSPATPGTSFQLSEQPHRGVGRQIAQRRQSASSESGNRA